MSDFLPTERHKPRTSLAHYIIFLYGPPKIGKTTFVSQIRDTLFLATEPGTAALEVFDLTISSWTDFTTALEALANSPEGKQYKAVCIDTVGLLWDLLLADICRRKGWDDVNEGGFAEGYTLAKRELNVAISQLRALEKLIIFVCHERRVAEEDDNGKRTGATMITCDLPNSARKVFLAQSDFVVRAFLDEDNERSLRLQPLRSADEYIECGCRGDINRPMPDTVPLSFKEFHKAFATAFGAPKKKRSVKAKTNQVITQQEASA